MTPCFDCGSSDRAYGIKIIPYNQGFIKYIPQFKESCKGCSRYIRFAPQTPELIGKFNELLKGVIIND